VIDKLKQTIEKLKIKEGILKSELETLEEQVATGKANMRELFGTDDVKELENIKSGLEQSVSELEAQINEITKDLNLN